MGINYSPRIVTDGLVLCLDAANIKSYSGSGTTWFDLSKSGNNGTWSNNPTFSNNNNGTFQFVPSGARVNLEPLSLSDTVNFTVSVWGNFQTYTGTTRPRFFSLSQSGINLQFGHNESGRQNELYIRYNDTLYAALAMNPDNWGHYVVTKNDNTVTFYVNGKASTTISTTVPTAAATGNYIGSYSTTTSAATLNGFFGQLLYYQRPLSAAEISQNFNATRGRYGI